MNIESFFVYGYVFILYIFLFMFMLSRVRCIVRNDAAIFFPVAIEFRIKPPKIGRYFQTPASYAKTPWHCSNTLISSFVPGSCHGAKYVYTVCMYMYKNRRLTVRCNGWWDVITPYVHSEPLPRSTATR